MGNQHSESKDSKDKSRADELRKSGNSEFKNGNYKNAIKLYSAAINMQQQKSPTLYFNRSACYIMVKNYVAALNDVEECVKLNMGYYKAYPRIISCCFNLGRLDVIEQYISKVYQLKDNCPEHLKLYSKHVEESLNQCSVIKTNEINKEYKEAIENIDKLLKRIESVYFTIKKCEYLKHLEKIQEAETLLDEVLKNEKNNLEALHLKAVVNYLKYDLYTAMEICEKIQKLGGLSKSNQLLKKIKTFIQQVDMAELHTENGDFKKSEDIYNELVVTYDDNKKLLARILVKRSVVNSKLGNNDLSIMDCDKALELDPSYSIAYLKRSQYFLIVNDLLSAKKDLESIALLEEDYYCIKETAKQKLDDLNIGFYYKILNVEVTASPSEIVKAYKKRALEIHPDKHVNKPMAIKKRFEECFKEVSHAYDVLSNPNKRARYDKQQFKDNN